MHSSSRNVRGPSTPVRDVAVAAITSRQDRNHGPFRRFMEKVQGDVELFFDGSTMSKSVTREFKQASHPGVSLTPGHPQPSGHYVSQNGLLWWMPADGNKNEVAFQDLGTNERRGSAQYQRFVEGSPLYRLFDSPNRPISQRFDETPPPGRPAPANFDEDGSSFFTRAPVYATDGYTLVSHAFPVFTAPMLLLILLAEIFHPHRRNDKPGDVPERAPVDQHWFALQELLDTADDSDANHLSRNDFIRGVFNKANPEEVGRLSKVFSSTMRRPRLMERLLDYEYDLLEHEGRQEEWAGRAEGVKNAWRDRLVDLDRKLKHETASPNPPSRPIPALSAYHAGPRNALPPPQAPPKRPPRPTVFASDAQRRSSSPPPFPPNPSQVGYIPFVSTPQPARQTTDDSAVPLYPVAATSAFNVGPRPGAFSAPPLQQPNYSPYSATQPPAQGHEGSYRLQRRLNTAPPAAAPPFPPPPQRSYIPYYPGTDSGAPPPPSLQPQPPAQAMQGGLRFQQRYGAPPPLPPALQPPAPPPLAQPRTPYLPYPSSPPPPPSQPVQRPTVNPDALPHFPSPADLYGPASASPTSSFGSASPTSPSYIPSYTPPPASPSFAPPPPPAAFPAQQRRASFAAPPPVPVPGALQPQPRPQSAGANSPSQQQKKGPQRFEDMDIPGLNQPARKAWWRWGSS
ncbi:hypothetical protein JCM6882_001529 [Rhodosporidiobolus microsporus]